MQALILTVFLLGYLFIILENILKINKAATALVTGVLCWTIYGFCENAGMVTIQLGNHLKDSAGILFFLLGAMTIVELIDSHNGFDIITSRIGGGSGKRLLWTLSLISFFLSAVLDNLTTAIVMVSLCRKLIDDRNDRLIVLGMIIIAVNAGGAWSPIGDVTTTMLWMDGRVSTLPMISRLFLPSLVCLLVPLLLAGMFMSEKEYQRQSIAVINSSSRLIFWCGMLALLFVPLFKDLSGLPPYMGILLGLGILWIITELIHKKKDEEDKKTLSVAQALRRTDTPTILFFLGILMAVGAMESTGQLAALGSFLDEKLGNISLLSISIGFVSAIVDNVPIVAGTMGMISTDTFPMDHYFWEFIAYCAGTGGSILVIGSAAGVAVMGMEKIDFFWYLKRISLLALTGYLAGAAVYIGQEWLRG